MSMQDDARLCGQEAYLAGVTLVYQPWNPANPHNDHDHCEFCWAKFMHRADCLQAGYSTEDRGRWICEECYHDFKERFKWRLKE